MNTFGSGGANGHGIAGRMLCLAAVAVLQAGCVGPGGRPDPVGTALLLGVIGAAASHPPPPHAHHQQQQQAKPAEAEPQQSQTQKSQPTAKEQGQKTPPSSGDGDQAPPAR